jgi:hypothetical protein
MTNQSNSDINKVALNMYFNLCALWKLNDDQKRSLLGDPPMDQFNAWMNGYEADALDEDAELRISHFAGIHSALKTLLKTESAYEWIHKPNSNNLFKGQSALSFMLSGGLDEISLVHQYLESQCH